MALIAITASNPEKPMTPVRICSTVTSKKEIDRIITTLPLSRICSFVNKAARSSPVTIPPVSPKTIEVGDDTICSERLMSGMETGRQYYMAAGARSAVVRLNNEGMYQYLEIQSGNPSENGWHSLTLSDLYSRFGCEDGQSGEYANYIIDFDSLQNNTEFLELLGYINTDESAQMRGESGYVR